MIRGRNLLSFKWGISANGQSKVGHFSHAKVNLPFGANGKVKWGILANIPFSEDSQACRTDISAAPP